MSDEQARKPKPKMSSIPGNVPLVEERLRLTVDRIIVGGLEMTPLEAQRFDALLATELKRLLAEQAAVSMPGIQNETLRSDWGAIVLEMDNPGGMAELANEIARRLALTLQTAAQKGAA